MMKTMDISDISSATGIPKEDIERILTPHTA